jgi:hypothetical protein
MAVGASLLVRPSDLLFAAGSPADATGSGESDGTRYGKYIHLMQNSAPTERGIMMYFMMGGDLPGFSTVIIGRMPPPGPMPGHDAPEKHDGEMEYLIHLGNNPNDPFDLGADVDFFLGKGKWQEHYELTKTTAVYLPNGMWHCPWKVKKIRTAMNWVNLRVGKSSQSGMSGAAPGGVPAAGAEVEAESQEERSKAKTSGYIFDKYLLSGVPKDMKNPEGGRWIAYSDCTRIDGGALTRIIRYMPDEAPYPVIGSQTHEYASMFIFLGTDLNDCTNLGAEVELLIGPEKERHTINRSAFVYLPADMAYGPFKVTKATEPFNFLEVVAGPELPGAVQG